MAKVPAVPTTTPAPAPARQPRRFQPQHVESRPHVPANEADAIARIAERRHPRRTAAPPPQTQPEPAAPPSGSGLPFSPLTDVLSQPGPGPALTPQPVARAPAMPQPGPAGGMVEVVINGQVVPVTLDELRRGYMRQQDYSVKTAAAADQLKQAQSAHAAFDHARVTLEQRLPHIIAGLQDEFSQPIDWVKLAREDPIGYAQKDARHKQYLAAKQEQDNLIALRQREDQNRKLEMRRLGHDFLAQVLPGWADPVSRQQLQALQTAHLQSVGYTPEEIAAYEALDPRQIVILEESRRFRVIAAMYPDLLRLPEMHPENPQARGVTPSTLPGNGLLSTREPGAINEATAQENWETARGQGGSTAREAAVSLIAARRARRSGM